MKHTLLTLDTVVKDFAEAHERLAAEVTELNQAIDDLKRRYLPKIKFHVARTAEQHAGLKAAIEDSPELFVKPRTIVLRGVEVGFKKAKGKITWDNEDQVLKLIKRIYLEDAPLYIRTQECPNKTALAELPAGELKKLGISVEETGDQVVIRPTDNGVEKLVRQLMADATDGE